MYQKQKKKNKVFTIADILEIHFFFFFIYKRENVH